MIWTHHVTSILLEEQYAWTTSSGRETNETKLHPNMKGKHGFLLCKWRRFMIHKLKAYSLDKDNSYPHNFYSETLERNIFHIHMVSKPKLKNEINCYGCMPTHYQRRPRKHNSYSTHLDPAGSLFDWLPGVVRSPTFHKTKP